MIINFKIIEITEENNMSDVFHTLGHLILESQRESCIILIRCYKYYVTMSDLQYLKHVL